MNDSNDNENDINDNNNNNEDEEDVVDDDDLHLIRHIAAKEDEEEWWSQYPMSSGFPSRALTLSTRSQPAPSNDDDDDEAWLMSIERQTRSLQVHPQDLLFCLFM